MMIIYNYKNNLKKIFVIPCMKIHNNNYGYFCFIVKVQKEKKKIAIRRNKSEKKYLISFKHTYSIFLI